MASKREAVSFFWQGKRRWRVFKHSNGHWYADRREGGKRTKFSLRVSSRPEAEDAVRRLDGISAEYLNERPDLTVQEACKHFITACENRSLAPNSVSRYQVALDSFMRFCQKTGLRFIRSVTLQNLEDFQIYRTKEENCEPKTVYADAIVVKGLFKYASHPARGGLTMNPALHWQVREPVKERPYCYTTEEVEMLIAGCREWLRPVITTLAFTGMRIGELINLRWEDVDLKENVIHVCVREDWKPKGRCDRAIPMHPRVREVIISRPLGKFVFLGCMHGKLKENRTLECFKKDRDRLGIHKGTLHTFRHFFISMCASSGKVPLATCMAWVGHKDAETVWCYYHLSETASREAMDRLAASGEGSRGQIWAKLTDSEDPEDKRDSHKSRCDKVLAGAH
jgi:integrase